MSRDAFAMLAIVAGAIGGCSALDAARAVGNATAPKPTPNNTTFVCQLPAVAVGEPAACDAPDEAAIRDALIEGHCVRSASHPSRYRCVFPSAPPVPEDA